jgi:outer membrane scaffolding protein for murein synthesis (MipA/OmpV family)
MTRPTGRRPAVLRTASLAGMLAFVALPLTAAAAELPLWELGGGLGVLSLPHYRGSDQSRTWLLPVPYIVYRGKIFKADREGARAVLYNSDRVDFDLSAGASAPASSNDDEARRGMEDLKPSVELGPNMNLTLARAADWKLDLRLPLRAAVTVERNPRMVGFISTPHVTLDLRDVAGWKLGLQTGLVYADRRFNAHFYEVRPDQAIAGRPAYQARSGYGGWQALAAVSRRSGRWWAGGFVRFDSLRGAVFDDSPLVRQRQHWSGGFALTYVFATSSTTVSSED